MRRENMALTDLMAAPWQIAGMPQNTPVLLALSGGADSRFLLHVLSLLAKRDGFSITAAHVDHGIRGEDSARDAAFCASLAQSYGIELCTRRADVLRLAAESGKGVEEAAREVRYSYFATLMKERAIPLLVTAHNADDNAETVLFRLARGTGLTGLGAIAPIRPFEGGYLVRPMLGLSKRAILSYCASEGLDYVTDATNSDVTYARNRIRAEALPVLEGLFEGAAERISEMTAWLREDEAVLHSITERFLEAHCQDGACPIGPLFEQPQAIRRRVLTELFQSLLGVRLERAHVDALLQLAQNAVPHSAVTLPSGASAVIERGTIRLREDCAELSYCVPLQMGETRLPDGKTVAVVGDGADFLKIHKLSTAPHIILKNSSAIIKRELHWRPRREGDKILLRGMHRSVRKLYREAGLSLAQRATLPLLCDADGIVWIPLIGARDGVCTARDAEEGTHIALRGVEPPIHG